MSKQFCTGVSAACNSRSKTKALYWSPSTPLCFTTTDREQSNTGLKRRSSREFLKATRKPKEPAKANV
jgi:hypothetical protein